MAIEKKLICFARLEEFERQLAAGNILDYSIVFIQDAKKIWTRGVYYDCNSDIKQDALVSGTNIKTINGTSILGSGNIVIEGGETLTESDIAAMGFTKNTGTYSKPSGGIPSSDLDTATQNILQAADENHELIQDFNVDIAQLQDNKQDKLVSGTNIKTINGTSLLGSGNIEIESGEANVQSDWNVTDTSSDAYIKNKPTIPTKTSQLINDKGYLDRTAGDQSYIKSEKVGESVYAYVNGLTDDQMSYALPTSSDGDEDDILLSRNTVKTINGESIVGSGNIVISGGSGGSGAYSEVNHGTADTTFTLTPNTFHVWDEVASLTLDFGSETSGVANEFLFQFTSGATATSLTLPDDIKWANDSAPTIEPNMIYQVSVLKGLASVLEFSNTPSEAYINFTISNTPYVAEEGMTWSEWCISAYNTSDWRTSGNIVRNIGDSTGYHVISDVTPSSIIVNGSAYSSYFYSLDIP